MGIAILWWAPGTACGSLARSLNGAHAGRTVAVIVRSRRDRATRKVWAQAVHATLVRSGWLQPAAEWVPEDIQQTMAGEEKRKGCTACAGRRSVRVQTSAREGARGRGKPRVCLAGAGRGTLAVMEIATSLSAPCARCIRAILFPLFFFRPP